MPDAALRELAAALDATGLDPAPRDTVPVLPALRPVVPGGLRPGSVVGLGGPGAASLGSALVAGASRHGGEDGAGGWCGVVGLPGFGVAAAAGMGAAPERLLLVDDPGDRWPDVVAALCEAVELILLCPPERPGPAAVRRLSALARKHGCVLTLTGPFAGDWPGTRLRLRLDAMAWDGIAEGHGRLTGRRARIVAEGRDAPGRGRRTRVWLPAPDGTVRPDESVRPPLQLVPEPVADGAPVHPRTSALPPRVQVPAEEGIA
ncbi:hypothetical protein [Actinomadura sp. KC345]|uniref:hypothetical protein n=1 Tax=Actinomadura sp. KC345 TaxID=2530371 RepID=UPI001A9FD575|nr:hypothetical protein [Actinomadura sp. KC345]